VTVQLFSSWCRTCNVGLSGDAKTVARWMSAHVGRPDLEERARAHLSIQCLSVASSIAEGEHVVEVRGPITTRSLFEPSERVVPLDDPPDLVR
jgi:hypothetical protein